MMSDDALAKIRIKPTLFVIDLIGWSFCFVQWLLGVLLIYWSS